MQHKIKYQTKIKQNKKLKLKNNNKREIYKRLDKKYKQIKLNRRNHCHRLTTLKSKLNRMNILNSKIQFLNSLFKMKNNKLKKSSAQ